MTITRNVASPESWAAQHCWSGNLGQVTSSEMRSQRGTDAMWLRIEQSERSEGATADGTSR